MGEMLRPTWPPHAHAGEMLGQLERAPEGRPQKLIQPGTVSEYRAVLTESDVATTTAHRWQTIAAVFMA